MNKFSITYITILILLLQFQCCTQTGSNSIIEDAKKSIAESNALYFHAFVLGDSSLFIQRYSDECLIMKPNSKSLAGQEGALEFFKSAYYKKGLRGGKFITQEVYCLDDNYVVEVGAFQLLDAEGNLFDDGKYLVLWKKTLQGWKMHRDSFSSNRSH